MKLKSLKIITFLFLVLSFQAVYAEDDGVENFTTTSCQTQLSELSTEQINICLTYKNNKAAQKDNPEINAAEMFNLQKQKLANKIGTKSSEAYCQAKNFTAPSNEGVDYVKSYGSSALRECDTLALGQMKNLYSKNGAKNAFDWMPYINYSCRDKCSGNKANESGQTVDNFKNCVNSKRAVAMKCESAAFVMNSYGRNWAEDQVQPVSASTSSGAGKVSASTNGQQATTSVGASSVKCVSAGVETVDYEPCKQFQVQLDLIEGVQQVGYQTQSLVYSDKLMDSQSKYAAEQNTATGALKATGESLKMQQDMMEQRTAVEATKLAYAYKLYSEMPRSEDVKAKCQNAPSVSVKFDTASTPLDKTECENAIRVQSGFQLLQNQAQLDSMKSKLVAIATATGSNMLLANLLGKRADDIDGAIAKIDAFKPVDPYTTSEADAQSTLCKMNPGLAQCLTAGLDRTFDTMNDNVITFGDAATGTSYGTNNSLGGTTSTTGTTDPTSRTAVTPVGSIVAAAAADGPMEKADAAKVTTSGTGSSGNGSGGSSSGAGGALGGSGGAPAVAGGAASAAIAGKAPTYGGGGSFSVMGGFGINKKKAEGKDEGNPFGKLFGKDTPKGDGVLNFRDIASQKVGSKGDNLFDMISKRYSSVNADKRLLEYELAK